MVFGTRVKRGAKLLEVPGEARPSASVGSASVDPDAAGVRDLRDFPLPWTPAWIPAASDSLGPKGIFIGVPETTRNFT